MLRREARPLGATTSVFEAGHLRVLCHPANPAQGHVIKMLALVAQRALDEQLGAASLPHVDQQLRHLSTELA